jgi:small nuclear ribonucleoprotein (snRNP)-like protein
MVSNRPFDVLESSVGKEIVVTLKGNVQVKGILRAFDAHMNLHLESASQIIEGEVKSSYQKVLLRGDSVILVAP